MYPDENMVRASVYELIRRITGRKEDEIKRGVVDCMTAAICNPDCPVPDRQSIQAGMQGLALKFHVNGYFGLSAALEKAMIDLLESNDLQDYDRFLPWNALKFLRELSLKPMDHALEAALVNQASVEEADGPLEEKFDWGAYLRDDAQVFDADVNEDSSDWSQLSDEEEGGYKSPHERVRSMGQNREKSRKQLGRRKWAEHQSQRDRDSDEWSQLSDEDQFGDEPLAIQQPHTSATASTPRRVGRKKQEKETQCPSVPDIAKKSRRVSKQVGAPLAPSPALLNIPGLIPPPRGSSLVQPYSDNPFVTRENFVFPTTFPSGYSEEVSSSSESDGQVTEKNVVKEELALGEESLAAYLAAFQVETYADDLLLDNKWFSEEKLESAPGQPLDDVGCLYFPTVGLHGDVDVLPEHHVLRDVLGLLIAPTECRCFGLDPNGNYQPRPDFTLINVSVISLWTYLSTEFCPFFDMVRQLEVFGADLVLGDVDPPSTYIAYWDALLPHVDDFKAAMTQVIESVARQDSINTLMSVKHELRPHLDLLAYIMKLHCKATCDWQNEDNWFSAIRLLAVLYQEIIETSSEERKVLSLELFLKSFQPYMMIMDYWLTQDNCIDVKNEFVIFKGSDMDSSMRDTWHEGMFVHPWRERLGATGTALTLGAMSYIENMVLLGCKSAYILGAMRQLQVPERQAGSLYSDFLYELRAEFSRFSTSARQLDSGFTSDGELEASPSTLTFKLDMDNQPGTVKTKCEFSDDMNVDCEEVKSRMLETLNPDLHDVVGNDLFLLAAASELDQEDTGEENVPEMSVLHEKISSILPCALSWMPIHHLLEGVLHSLVEQKYRWLGSHINTVLREEMNIKSHLEDLRRTFFLESGNITAIFLQQIDKKKEEPCWLYAHYLTCHLREQQSAHTARFWAQVDERFLDRNVVNAIDGLTLGYKVDWPLSLIITPNLPLYNEIFRLLLKLQWSTLSLLRLRFDEQGGDENNVDCKTRLERWRRLRFWVQNAVAGFHHFTMSHVLHCFGPELNDLIEHGYDFDQLIKAHCEYLQTIHQMCVNPFEGSHLRVSFDHLLTLAQCVVDYWGRSSRACNDHKLQKMEALYRQLHQSIGNELKGFILKDSRINVESLLPVFCSPLTPVIGLQNQDCY